MPKTSLREKQRHGTRRTVPLALRRIRVQSFFLIIQETMAIAFKIGIGDLIAELFAHAFDVFAFSYATGAVTALGFKAVLDGLDDLFVFV